MPLDKEFILEQEIFLGGKISNVHPIFKEIAKMSPDYADLYFIIKKMTEWENEQDENKLILSMLEIFGEIDLVRNCSELTRLSMILGDTRARHNIKGMMVELRKPRVNPTT